MGWGVGWDRDNMVKNKDTYEYTSVGVYLMHNKQNVLLGFVS